LDGGAWGLLYCDTRLAGTRCGVFFAYLSGFTGAKVNLLFAARRLRQVWWMRIAIGLAMFAVAFVVRWLISVDGFPFITFFPAVLAAGMLGGVSAGAICGVLGLVAARYYFTSPSFYLGLNTATSLVPLLLFALAGGIELLLIGVLNRAIDELWLARERSNTLFRELQHRVANNLQFVAALLHLQRKLPLSKDAALASANVRLEIMGRIHRKLYDPANADRPITDFLRDLCGDLVQSAGVSNVTLNIIDAPLKLSFEKIIPLALMVAEIVTNSLKHAFPDGRPGTITIALKAEPAPLCTLVVADDGIGFSETGGNDTQEGLGRRVIESLAAQLDATTVTSTDHGGRVAITFRP
jgi:two-component sensor histidine kinase